MRSRNKKPVQRVTDPQIREEMHFRHSLLKLMTSPEYSGVSISAAESERSVAEAQRLEQLVAVPVRRSQNQARAAG